MHDQIVQYGQVTFGRSAMCLTAAVQTAYWKAAKRHSGQTAATIGAFWPAAIVHSVLNNYGTLYQQGTNRWATVTAPYGAVLLPGGSVTVARRCGTVGIVRAKPSGYRPVDRAVNRPQDCDGRHQGNRPGDRHGTIRSAVGENAYDGNQNQTVQQCRRWPNPLPLPITSNTVMCVVY